MGKTGLEMRGKQSHLVREFFDEQYASVERYWWLGDNRYKVDPSVHTPLNAALLRLLARSNRGKALDVGAGEGADAIRLATMGFSVTAVELSAIGTEKIGRFAREQNVVIDIVNEDIRSFVFQGYYDIVVCNGMLHYVRDKRSLLDKMKAHTAPLGLNVISCFTDFTPVPDVHKRVPVYPDREDGAIAQAYRGWINEFWALERAVPERSHMGFPPHSHSYIKLIARRPSDNPP